MRGTPPLIGNILTGSASPGTKTNHKSVMHSFLDLFLAVKLIHLNRRFPTRATKTSEVLIAACRSSVRSPVHECYLNNLKLKRFSYITRYFLRSDFSTRPPSLLVIMTNKMAEGYQQNSRWQRNGGKRFVQNEVEPYLSNDILDLGCGTGELSAYLAKLAGPKGRVLAVDPDKERIRVAKESYREVENLTFVVGSTSSFPGLGLETYNVIFSNFVLHWIKNIEDKKKAFENMFRSLKPTGKIFVRYGDRMPTHFDRVFRELNPENLDCLMSINQFEPRPVIEQIRLAAGFRVLNSFDEKFEDRVFENGESLCLFFWATTNGVFDPQFVTEDRMERFCARYSSRGNGTIKLRPEENDLCSVLVAEKPADLKW